MKKLLALGLLSIAAMSVISLSSCASSTSAAETFDIALITDIGEIDDKSFNQGTWEGIHAYATEHSISHTYYKPEEQSTTAYVSAIDLAVANGAKVVVTPGFLFEEPIFIVQETYPNVHFILIDGVPHNQDYSVFLTKENVQPILFAEEQAGFLAGWGAVMEGYRSLGFMGGMAFPAVVRFGMGFVYGANAAAAELDVDIAMKYHYTGGFAATPEVETKASTWYQSGVEVIFACGGSLGQSVMASAETKLNKKVIGVDVDQAADSTTVITSAMKRLGVAVQLALADHFDNTWDGGETWTLDASNDGIGLPKGDSWRFATWTLVEYEALVAELAAGTVTVVVDIDQGEDAVGLAAFDATLPYVTISFEA